MKEFFVTYQSQLIAAIISFVVALLTSLLSHFLGNFKLRYTEKLKITSNLSKMKYEGIEKIRKEIRVLLQYEDLGITDESSLISENVSKKNYTPSCCYSYEELNSILIILNDLYGEYGHCLSHTTVIYLVCFRNLLMEYNLKCRRAGFTDQELRWVSVPLYEEIQSWYKKIDKELISSMNKPSMRYFAHSGLKYSILLKIYGIRFEKSFLYKYINDKNSFLNEMIHMKNKRIDQQIINI